MRWSTGAHGSDPMTTRILLALVGAPLLALLDQSTAFAIVSWSCAHGNTVVLHAVHGLFLAATVTTGLFAFSTWRSTISAAPRPQAHFLAGMATATAALSVLAIAAMWMPVWMISSCIA